MTLMVQKKKFTKFYDGLRSQRGEIQNGRWQGHLLKIYQNIDKMEKMHRITLNSTAEKVKKNHFIVMP